MCLNCMTKKNEVVLVVIEQFLITILYAHTGQSYWLRYSILYISLTRKHNLYVTNLKRKNKQSCLVDLRNFENGWISSDSRWLLRAALDFRGFWIRANGTCQDMDWAKLVKSKLIWEILLSKVVIQFLTLLSG